MHQNPREFWFLKIWAVVVVPKKLLSFGTKIHEWKSFKIWYKTQNKYKIDYHKKYLSLTPNWKMETKR